MNKRTISLLLVLVLLITASTPAFAEQGAAWQYKGTVEYNVATRDIAAGVLGGILMSWSGLGAIATWKGIAGGFILSYGLSASNPATITDRVETYYKLNPEGSYKPFRVQEIHNYKIVTDSGTSYTTELIEFDAYQY